jgi:hypothetical protein
MSEDERRRVSGDAGGDVNERASFSEPPTFTNEPVPGRPGVVRPVLSKPIRIDPETGAVGWD